MAHLQIDLAAERLIAAERGEEKIAVEIKSFIGTSQYFSVSWTHDDDRPLNPPILGDFDESGSPRIGG